MMKATLNQPAVCDLDVDSEGFLYRPETWTREVACLLAQGEVPGGLTDDHWKVIDCLRQFYLEFGAVPPLRMIRHRTGFNIERLWKLFPSGLARGACRIAGMPRATISPSSCYL